MGKEADLLFTIPVGTPFWVLEEHEPPIVEFFSLLSHAGNGEFHGMSKGASCIQGHSERCIEHTRGNGKGSYPISWEWSYRKIRNKIVR